MDILKNIFMSRVSSRYLLETEWILFFNCLIYAKSVHTSSYNATLVIGVFYTSSYNTQNRRGQCDHSDLGSKRTGPLMVKLLYFERFGRPNNY